MIRKVLAVVFLCSALATAQTQSKAVIDERQANARNLLKQALAAETSANDPDAKSRAEAFGDIACGYWAAGDKAAAADALAKTEQELANVPTTGTYSRDYTRLQIAERLLRVGAFDLARTFAATLTDTEDDKNKSEFQHDLAAALAEQVSFTAAEEAANAVPDADEKEKALAELAEIEVKLDAARLPAVQAWLRKFNNPDLLKDAKYHLIVALTASGHTKDAEALSDGSASDVGHIAEGYAREGNLDKSRQLNAQLPDGLDKIIVYTEQARTLHKAGNTAAITALLTEVEAMDARLMDKDATPTDFAQALGYAMARDDWLVDFYGAAGAYDRALAGKFQNWDDVLKVLSWDHAAAGDFAAAYELSKKIQGRDWRGAALMEIARDQAKAGDVMGAVAAAGQENDAFLKANLLIGAAKGLTETLPQSKPQLIGAPAAPAKKPVPAAKKPPVRKK